MDIMAYKPESRCWRLYLGANITLQSDGECRSLEDCAFAPFSGLGKGLRPRYIIEHDVE